jgi:hypothetical protein
VLAAVHPPEHQRECGVQQHHEGDERDDIAGAGAEAGAVRDGQDPRHGGGVLVQGLRQPDIEHRVDLAEVIGDVADGDALEQREHQQDERPRDHPGQHDRATPPALVVPGLHATKHQFP